MSDYVPFGDEWKAEVMRLKKSEIIDMLAKALRENASRPTRLALDEGQAIANNVREAIKEARHWMLESETDPRPEIKREVVITYLNMIERSLETPLATKA